MSLRGLSAGAWVFGVQEGSYMETMETMVTRRPEPGSETPELIPGYFARIDKGQLLTHEEEIALSRRGKAGDERARQRLVEKNLRLVVSLAKRYRGLGVPFEDLLQEGNAGLLKAVEGFDPEKGFRFSTYATKWIKKALGQAVHDNSRTIRLPVHVGERLMRARREIGRRRAEGGPAMSLEDVSYKHMTLPTIRLV